MDKLTIRQPLTYDFFTAVVGMVADAFLVNPMSIANTRRGKPVVAAARLALYTLLYERTNASLEEIARRMERHHTTVLDGIQRTATWRETAPAWHQALEAVRARL